MNLRTLGALPLGCYDNLSLPSIMGINSISWNAYSAGFLYNSDNWIQKQAERDILQRRDDDSPSNSPPSSVRQTQVLDVRTSSTRI